jgi:hypothetical protein
VPLKSTGLRKDTAFENCAIFQDRTLVIDRLAEVMPNEPQRLDKVEAKGTKNAW